MIAWPTTIHVWLSRTIEEISATQSPEYNVAFGAHRTKPARAARIWYWSDKRSNMGLPTSWISICLQLRRHSQCLMDVKLPAATSTAMVQSC